MSRRHETRHSRKNTPYIPAKLIEGARWYIEYYAFDPERDKLVRKREYVPKCATLKDKRKLGKRMVEEVNLLLHEGFVNDEEAGQKREMSTYQAFKYAVEIRKSETGKTNNVNYRSFFNVFGDWLKASNRSARSIYFFERKDAYAFFDYLLQERGVSPSTRNNYKKYVVACCNTLVNRGIIDHNPAEKIKDLQTTSSKHHPFTHDQKNQIEQYLLRHNPRLFYFTRFIYYGFIRPVEVCRMQVKDIDIDQRVILIWSTKSKNKRQMPVVINPQLAKHIEELEIGKLPPSYYLFSRKGEPGQKLEHRNRFSEAHSKALKALDMYDGNLSLYAWKHTGNINAYKAGVDIYSLMRQNRHHSLDQTEQYFRALGLRISKELKLKEW